VTAYLVPCGLSILDGLALSRCKPAESGDVESTLAGLVTWATRKHRASPDALADAWAQTYPKHAEALALRRWDHRVSAEISTLHGRAPALDLHRDTVVLLSSATDDGVLATLLVATRVARGDLARIHYAATPQRLGAAGAYPMDGRGVLVVLVSGLSDEAPDGFDRAAQGIGDVMRAVRDSVPGPIEVHLAGGHKATLMYCLALAEVLRSTVVDPSTVTAWYLFEERRRNHRAEEPSGNRTPVPAEIRLRRFPNEVLRPMAIELRRAEDKMPAYKRESPGYIFAEVGWESYGRGRRLNAFGHGFLALLRHLAPPAGEG